MSFWALDEQSFLNWYRGGGGEFVAFFFPVIFFVVFDKG